MLKYIKYYYYSLKRRYIYNKIEKELKSETKDSINPRKKAYYESELTKLALLTNKILKTIFWYKSSLDSCSIFIAFLYKLYYNFFNISSNICFIFYLYTEHTFYKRRGYYEQT